MSKKRVILSTIAILLVMFAAVSIVSYSIANLGHGDEIVQNETKNLGADNNTSNYLTNIDLIIDAANSKDSKTYASFNIVEIKPKSAVNNDSELGSYVSSGNFANNVLTAYRSTSANSMPAGSVTYNTIVIGDNVVLTTPSSYTQVVATGKDDSFAIEQKTVNGTVQDILDQADLIYMSSPLYTSYDGDSNMSEDVYNYLHYYASNNKPIIVDFVTSSSAGAQTKTISGLVNTIQYNYYKFFTFGWDTAKISAVDFFTSKGSYYLKLNANKKATTGNVLVLANTTTPGDGSMKKMMEDATAATIIENAYYGVNEKKPSDMKYTVLDVSKGLTLDDLSNVSTNYDFILLEDGIGDVTITEEVFNALRALSESGKHVIYNSKLCTSNSGTISAVGNNYLKLLQMLVNDKGIEQQNNVLPITYGYFASLNDKGDAGVEGAKPIADLINKTIYRDTATSGAAERKYRVLEIQPSYPIDLELASTLTGRNPGYPGITGSYYTTPDQVLYGVTKEEIPEGTEYYNFEISKAKIAHALQLPYDKIEVTSMSTNEFISSKEVVSEYYDLIYIGGDASAYIPYGVVRFDGYNNIMDNDHVAKAKEVFTSFNMYTHTGTFVTYHLNYEAIGGSSKAANGWEYTNSIETSGNDLTTIKRDELKAYVDAGLPIIVDQVVASAFKESYDFDPDNPDSKNKSRLEQLSKHHIDPDSNMYQFLAYAYRQDQDRVSGIDNIGWGLIDSSNSKTSTNTDESDDDLSNSEVRIENVDKQYGNTLGSSVTVYNCAAAIKTLVDGCNERPQLSLSKFPVEYLEGAENTKNISSDTGYVTTFKGSVSSPSTSASSSESYDVYLYVDANGDGTYSESERIQETVYTTGSSDFELNYTLAEDFLGLVNWKIVAYTSDGKLCDMKSGSAYFKPTATWKKTVKLLQIMPVGGFTADDTPFDENKHAIRSLYFCTECQQCGKEIEYNVTVDGQNQNGLDLASYKDRESVTIASNTVNVGKHIHKFGIAKHNTVTYQDDFEDDLSFYLTHGKDGLLQSGDFEFIVDIVSHTEFDELCKAALERTDVDIEASRYKVEGIEEDKTTNTPKLIGYEEAYKTALEDLRKSQESKDMKNALIAFATVLNDSGVRYQDVVAKGILGDNVSNLDATPNGRWLEDQDYYKVWSYINDSVYGSTNNALKDTTITRDIKDLDGKVIYQAGTKPGLDILKDLITKYNAYNTKREAMIEKYEQYRSESQKCGDETDWLSYNYNVIVLGLADQFGTSIDTSKNNSADLSYEACQQLKTYIKNGGSVVNSHDSINAKATKARGAYTLTNELRELFGMDRFHVVDYNDSKKVDVSVQYADSTEISKGSFVIGDKNISATMTTAPSTEGVFTYESLNTAVGEDGILQVDITVKTSEGDLAPDTTLVTCEYRKNVQTANTVNGVATFTIDPKYKTNLSVFDTPTDGSIYRHFKTEDSEKYFWTQRLQTTDSTLYTAMINSTGGMVKYNAPVGISDLYAVYDNAQKTTGPYRYVSTEKESFDHAGTENDGGTYQAHYGTRKAQQVNKGGVTMFPFNISEELRISPTHAQTFNLDLEDPTVAVWYTLGGTYLDTSGKLGTSVSSSTAQYVSAYYAASPRDGLNNYFLYSKDGVYYTGAGHMRVTGNKKDNNDERRLFINVIVNAVTKGKASPLLKLYNKCDGGDDCKEQSDNCNDYYVDPSNVADNQKLSKKSNTLFYNKGINMYQYNIDDTEEKIYPEFDFKAIAGSEDIDKIEVFYDLNYNPADESDPDKRKEAYKFDGEHDVMIEDYDETMDSQRGRIRKPDPEPADEDDDPLLLKDEYFTNYGDYTYIVVRVQDKGGTWKSARIKINKIPYLFDLTDVDTESQELFDGKVLDMSDRKFNI